MFAKGCTIFCWENTLKSWSGCINHWVTNSLMKVLYQKFCTFIYTRVKGICIVPCLLCMVSTVSVYLFSKNSWQGLSHCLIDLGLHSLFDTIHTISCSLCHSGWVSFMFLGSSNRLMVREIIKSSLINISIKNGD